ncbi:unnamed protein product [Porites evermanni]|uniref:Uncharacterized protein n=1 Tax=Porites evermanni TaxID=104178 RepID=A0ABN8PK23_9CNID|nr:unnamed protein product [Porites evermanni]
MYTRSFLGNDTKGKSDSGLSSGAKAARFPFNIVTVVVNIGPIPVLSSSRPLNRNTKDFICTGLALIEAGYENLDFGPAKHAESSCIRGKTKRGQ